MTWHKILCCRQEIFAVTKCIGQLIAGSCQQVWICTLWRGDSAEPHEEKPQERSVFFTWDSCLRKENVVGGLVLICNTTMLWDAPRNLIQNTEASFGEKKNRKSYWFDWRFDLIFFSTYQWKEFFLGKFVLFRSYWSMLYQIGIGV